MTAHSNIPADQHIPLDDLAGTGELVIQGVDALIASLNHPDSAHRLSDFLPAASPGRRRLILIELIKVDMKHRLLRKREAVRVEEYLHAYPELQPIPVALMHEELQLRHAAGDKVSFDEYLQRFPEAADSFARFIETARQTTPPTHPGTKRSIPEMQPGEMLGEFRIQRLLGKGAFAQVYLAWQTSLQRTVALKVARDRGAEPQTLAQLDHLNIVRVFDLRLMPDRELSLLSMKFVPGGTLDDVISLMKQVDKQNWNGQAFLAAIDAAMRANEAEPAGDSEERQRLRQMSWPAIVSWIGMKMAAALDYAHHRGVLHRDIKPANILLSANGEPQLADFNVSSAALKEPGPVAIFGGSLPFMAPEQLEVMEQSRSPDDIDARSDIYSLGMTLWKLLAGQRPFEEKHTGDFIDTLTSLIATRRAGLPSDVRAGLPANCPKSLVAILRKCLEGDPDKRFSDAGQLARALELSLHPETEALLLRQPWGPVSWVRRFPIAAMLPLGLAPNIIASGLNVLYNQAAVINAHPDAQPTFEKMMVVINGVLFPLALFAYCRYAWPVSGVMKRLTTGDAVTDLELVAARRRSLKFGSIASLVCIVCWIAAGILWPLSLDMLIGWMSWDAHLHFLISLTICGLIAAVYPFFLVTHLSLRAIMPPLLQAGHPHAEEKEGVDQLSRSLGPNLLAAAAVPFVGIATLVLIDSTDRWTMKALVAFGLIGCVFAYVLERQIRRDLAAMNVLYQPKP